MSEGKQKLYSSQMEDKSLIGTVLSIAGNHDSFHTHFYGHHGLENNENITERFEAWKNPVTDLWQVDRVVQIPAKNETDSILNKEKISGSDLCFFDALHMCSAFELEQREKGRLSYSSSNSGDADDIHWTKAAKSAGQAIDIDGQVHPCAYGRILVNGNFTQKENSIAKSSPTPVEQAHHQNQLKKSFAESNALQIIQQSQKSIDVHKNPNANLASNAQIYNNVIVAGDRLMKDYNKAYYADFKPLLAEDMVITSMFAMITLGLASFPVVALQHIIHPTLALGMFTATAVTPIAWLGLNHGIIPHSKMKHSILDFNKAAQNLPNKDDADLCLEFSTAVETGYWLAVAQLNYKNGTNQKAIAKTIEYLDKTIAVKGLSLAEGESLKSTFLKSPRSEDFKDIATKAWTMSTITNDNTEVRGLKQYLELRRG